MLVHNDFLKKFNYKDDKPRAVVPASSTADELQEIVSQGIWEWGVDKKFLNDDATKLEKDVLQAAFVAMAIGGNRMDSGRNKAKSWLTPGSKEFLIRSRLSNGSLKLSKALFTEGLQKELSIKVPWANVDNLWRRIMEEYPDESNPPQPDDGATTSEKRRTSSKLKTTTDPSQMKKGSHSVRPTTASPGAGFRNTTPSRTVRPKSAGVTRSSIPQESFPLDKDKKYLGGSIDDNATTDTSFNKKKKRFKKPSKQSVDTNGGNVINSMIDTDDDGAGHTMADGGHDSKFSSRTKDIFGSNIGEGDLLFGTRWKERLEKVEQERIEKNKRYEKQQRMQAKKRKEHRFNNNNATKIASGGGYDFASIEVNKTKCSHITFAQFAAAFTTHAKHRDNITRRNKIGADNTKLHGTEHVATVQDIEMLEVNKKAKARADESHASDNEWMASAYRLVMDAFDRDKLLLHEAFFAFDVAGDGAVSLGEFVGVLSRMKPKLPVTKKQMFAMFMALDVKCVRKVKLLEFVTFFLTLYDKKLRSLCEEFADLLGDITDVEESIEKLETQIKQLRQLAADNSEEEYKEEILANEETLKQLVLLKRETEEARDKVNETMRYTSTVVASAVDLLNIELAPPNEQYHGTYAAGISKYVPSTGKGSIASEYMFREDAARIGARHRARDSRRETRMKKLSADVNEVDESWDVEVIIDTEQEMREEKGRRTRRIHEMLARRVFQKNQILPIKQQVLGSTYKKSDDPMQWAVEAGKHQLKIEIIDRRNGAVEAANEIELLKDNIQHNMVKTMHHKDDAIALLHKASPQQKVATSRGRSESLPVSKSELHRRISLFSSDAAKRETTVLSSNESSQHEKDDNKNEGFDSGVSKLFGTVDKNENIKQSPNQRSKSQPYLSPSELPHPKMSVYGDKEEEEGKISENDSLSIDGKVLAKALMRDTTHKLLSRREHVLSPPMKSKLHSKHRGTVKAGLYLGQRNEQKHNRSPNGSPSNHHHYTDDASLESEEGEGLHQGSIGSKTLSNLLDGGGGGDGGIVDEGQDSSPVVDPFAARLKELHETAEMNISTADGLLPGRYAHLIRKVGMSDASVKREMLSLHLKTPEIENLHNAENQLLETQLAMSPLESKSKSIASSLQQGQVGASQRGGGGGGGFSSVMSPLKALKKWQKASSRLKEFKQNVKRNSVHVSSEVVFQESDDEHVNKGYGVEEMELRHEIGVKQSSDSGELNGHLNSQLGHKHANTQDEVKGSEKQLKKEEEY